MNESLRHLNKIEFSVTTACTGRCIHCQNGAPDPHPTHLCADAATQAIRQVAEHYRIKTVMTFGGEPLLFSETVCAIHKTAAEAGIAKRQVITNGFFSKDKDRIEAVANALRFSGVNDLRLSVDAFHQETIPIEPVRLFAAAAKSAGIPLQLQPAWLVSEKDDNPYNVRTREILAAFQSLGIPTGKGNAIFPSGNARKYLGAYFPENAASSPYEEDPTDIRTLSIAANGDVLNGNLYQTDILTLIRTYAPRRADGASDVRLTAREK